VLSASEDRTVREWERESGRELRRFEGHTGAVTSCAYSPDGARVLSASDDGTVKMFSCADAQCLFTVYGTGSFSAVALRAGQFCAGDVSGNLWFLDCDG
jgi:WD40 repeat protein